MKRSKWLAVIGTREVNPEISRAVRREIQTALADGWSIVSGGATGVDHEAATLVYQSGGVSRLKIYLPTTLDIYIKGLKSRASAGKCLPRDVVATIRLLQKIQSENPTIIIENHQFTTVNKQSFHARNNQIMEFCDAVMAFRANQSPGTTYTISMAQKLGKPIQVFDFRVDDINY
jgi:predicted Rossmann fold nucleotide-binding protein DprA/Smf involved in DNA uptake